MSEHSIKGRQYRVKNPSEFYRDIGFFKDDIVTAEEDGEQLPYCSHYPDRGNGWFVIDMSYLELLPEEPAKPMCAEPSPSTTGGKS